MPPKPDLVFHNAPNDVETVHTAFNVELSPTKPENDLSHTHRPSTPIIEDWVSDSEDESETQIPQNDPSFVHPIEQVKSLRPSVQYVETSIPTANPKIAIPKPTSNGKCRHRKVCFVCKSLTYLMKHCNYHEKKMDQTTARNHTHRGNHKQYASMTLLNRQRHVVPTASLTRSKLVPISAARPVTTVVPKYHVTRPRQAKPIVTESNSPPRRHTNRSPSPKSSTFPPKVTVVKAPMDKGVIDSGCSRHMTGNVSYLSDFEELNGGYVSFGGNPKGGKISRKGKIKIGKLEFDDVYFVKELKFNLFNENQVLLRVPMENNMYNVNLKNSVPSGDLTCHFAKATLDKSNLWHRRLGHINFKTMNKLVKDSLGKFDGKVDEGFLVGYSVSSKAFRVFNSRTRIVQEALHVNFLENKPNVTGNGPTWLFDIDTLTKTMNYQPVTVGNQSDPSLGREPKSKFNVSPSSSAQSKKHDDKTKREAKGKSPVDTLVPAVRQLSPNSTNTFSADGPSNAVASPIHRKSSCIDTSQYPDDPNMPELEDITYFDDEDNVGHTQEEGLDYEEVFAPVARIEAIRLFLAYASFMGFMVYQMDFKSAFLYGTIEEERGTIDQTLFIQRQKGDILLVQIYVDDFIFGSTNKDLCKAFEKLMKDKFQMSSMGELTFFLGLQVKQKKDGIFISQDKYVANILRKFGLTDGKSASTPIDTEKCLLKDPDGEDVDVHTYRSMIGSLMYLTSSRTDIMFAVCAYQMVSGKDSSNPLMADNLPKIVWYSTHHVALMKNWLVQKQTALGQTKTGKEISNPFMAGSLPKTMLLTFIHVNDVTRLQALVDKKKVVITKATIRNALCLDDAEGVEFLPNEEIFDELARMGYEKPLTKLTFYKAFFSSQWKFLIHTILQCMSAKRTSWNEFSSSMASVVIYLSTSRKFNFSKYIFDSLVRNVDSSTKFYMYPHFLQLMIRAQVCDLSSHTIKYSSPALTQKVFANIRRVGKGCSGVETPLFEGMIVEQQVGEGAAEVNVEDVSTAGVAAEGTVSAADNEVPAAVDEPSIPSPTPPTPPPQPLQDQPSTSHDVAVDTKDGQDAEIEEMEVVTTAKLITEVVTTASAKITIVAPQLTTAAAPTLTTAPSAARRRKGVVIRDPEESATPSKIIHSEAKSKDKGKGILVEEPKPLKKQAQIEQDEAYARELEAELNKNIDWDETKAQARKNMMIYLRNVAGFKMDYFKRMTYDDIRPIFEKKLNSNMAFLLKTKEQMDEEDSRALKRLSESQDNKIAKKQKLDEEVEELRRHLQIVPNYEDDVYSG
nr:putative ribonuclease H-like domain-containing protein [Tanacetum cinerariifolium]